MIDKTSILIIGAGPVGLILAHILGRSGVQVVLIESAAALSEEPRAVALDAEALRTLQALDLLDTLREELLCGLSGDYVNGAGDILFNLDGAQVGPLGYPNLTGINQPGLVRKLAAELGRHPSVSVCYNHTLLNFEQNDKGVSAVVENEEGKSRVIDADYLVGSDGGRSTVRSQLGFRMQGESNPQPWLVIDTREAEYDGLKRFRFYCDPRRPGMFMQTPHANRRWEWMLHPGEDREEFLKDDQIHTLISPYVDVSKVDVYRRRVYDFHAIIAEHFQRGRIFLVGDAAHMTPPFAGQGLNSGLRDAGNLGWKLAAVVRSGAPVSLLDSYELERWQHAKDLIDMAQILGQQIQPTDSGAAGVRDAKFVELNRMPGAIDGFVGGMFRVVWDRYIERGCVVGIGEEPLVGRMMSQPLVTNSEGEQALLDDFLGHGFSIIGYNCDPVQELGEELAKTWSLRGAELVSLGEADTSCSLTLESNSHLAALFSHGESNLALLRPDRFCMAAFTRENAAEALKKSGTLLGFG